MIKSQEKLKAFLFDNLFETQTIILIKMSDKLSEIKPEKSMEKVFSDLLNLLFESATHSCSYVPEEYHHDIYRGTLHYAFEKLCNDDIEKKKIAVKVYEKWSGHFFSEFDDLDSDSE
jgi:hypothetical protein